MMDNALVGEQQGLFSPRRTIYLQQQQIKSPHLAKVIRTHVARMPAFSEVWGTRSRGRKEVDSGNNEEEQASWNVAAASRHPQQSGVMEFELAPRC